MDRTEAKITQNPHLCDRSQGLPATAPDFRGRLSRRVRPSKGQPATAAGHASGSL
jgi:hypothetical protein